MKKGFSSSYNNSYYKNTQQIDAAKEWLITCSDNFSKSSKFDIQKTEENKIEINAHNVFLNFSGNELPYAFKACDFFGIASNTLKSLKNFPTTGNRYRYIEYFFHECNMLDFNTNTYPLCERSSISLYDMPNIHINDLEILNNISKIEHVYFSNCLNKNLYDFETYVTSIETLGMDVLYKLKNCSSLMSNNIETTDIILSHVSDSPYTKEQLKKLSEIINKYFNYQIKEDYVMDFTLELIDNMFEDEV